LARAITIYLKSGDAPIKQMLKQLMTANRAGNPYFDRRSESEVAKMLLLKEVSRAHKRFCGKPKKPKKRRKPGATSG
jgi:hypothetical protein